MPEYIEREALKAEIQRQMDDCKPMSEGRFYGASFLATVDLAPATDVETVRHGKWLINSDGYYPYCSECKEEPKSGIMTHYCPFCGAKMEKSDV